MLMNITANGTTNFPLISGRNYTFFIAGTFGSGTAALSLTDAGGGSLTMPDYPSFTAAGSFEFRAPVSNLSVVLSGATSPSIYVVVQLCED